MMKQTEQSLVERLRKYGTGSPDALLLMREAADALERQLAAPLSAELPSVCDGKEQDEFEAWAKGESFDVTTHPIHWLFLDQKTSAARKGWKGALEYVARAAQRAAPQLTGNSAELIAAAQAVVERWDSPKWKDQVHTGEFIDRLRKALAAPQEAPQQEPVAWLHEIVEPEGHTNRLFSWSQNNPWSHWLESLRDKCQYKATPLYAAPVSTISAKVPE